MNYGTIKERKGIKFQESTTSYRRHDRASELSNLWPIQRRGVYENLITMFIPFPVPCVFHWLGLTIDPSLRMDTTGSSLGLLLVITFHLWRRICTIKVRCCSIVIRISSSPTHSLPSSIPPTCLPFTLSSFPRQSTSQRRRSALHLPVPQLVIWTLSKARKRSRRYAHVQALSVAK